MHHAFDCDSQNSGMSQGLYVFTLTLFTYTSECVTVGQIIQLTHRRRERVLQKFFKFLAAYVMAWQGIYGLISIAPCQEAPPSST